MLTMLCANRHILIEEVSMNNWILAVIIRPDATFAYFKTMLI